MDSWETWFNAPGSAVAINAFTGEFMARFMAGAATPFGSDYEETIIFLGIITESERHLHDSWDFVNNFGDLRAVVPSSVVIPISRMASASAVRLPRETVRRKVNKLVKGGFLLQDDRGGLVVPPDLTSQPDWVGKQTLVLDLVRNFLADLTTFVGAPSFPDDVARRLDDCGVAGPVNALTAEFVLNYMIGSASLFNQDYGCAVIFLSAVAGGGKGIFRSPVFMTDYAATGLTLPPSLWRPVSRQSLARRTGLARETVRRKVAGLIEKGVLEEDPRRGVVVRSDFLSDPKLGEYFDSTVDDLRVYIANLINLAKIGDRPVTKPAHSTVNNSLGPIA